MKIEMAWMIGVLAILALAGCDSSRPVDWCSGVDCDDEVDCTEDRCNPDNGECEHTPDHSMCKSDEECDAAAGCVSLSCEQDADCNDGLYCTGTETCADGACQAGTPVDCDDGVDCTVDECDEQAQDCNNTPDDGLCAAGEACDPVAGCRVRCAGDADCDDGVGCTVDSCDEDGDVCVNQADDGACDNGDWCDGVETCDPQADCQLGVPVDCDDGVDCTVDSCDEDLDECVNRPDDGLCDDLDPCTGEETCDPDLGCLPGVPIVCDDGTDCTVDECVAGACIFTPDHVLCDDTNRCTADTCDPVGGCEYVVLPDDASCSDDNVCNGAEVCRGGMCRAGDPLFCADDNPCTRNYCLPAAGCMIEPEPAGTPCPDGDLCSGDETCDGIGACEPGVDLDCDDGNACTTDFCLPAEGCIQVANLDPCDDGDACTVDDRCFDGVCAGESREICGDGIDNDCDGFTDPDPPCLGDIGTFVAPPLFGSDGNPGTRDAPLATISAGIQNALIIGAPQAVYVAGDNSYAYQEDLVMAPGVSVYGGYSDDGNWNYDPEVYGTILAPDTAEGVKFLNAAIDRGTVLDGFAVFGLQVNGQGGLSRAVTVRGCSPTISRNWIAAGQAANCRAVTAEDGANPLLTSNLMWGSNCWSSMQVVRLEGSDADLQQNEIQGGQGPACVGVMLVSVGSVTIQLNQIRGGDAASGMGNPMAVAFGIWSTDGFDYLLIDHTAVVGGTSGGSSAITAGVRLEGCGGAEAEVLGNPYIVGGPAASGIGGEGLSFGLMADGDCPALVQGNGVIMGSVERTEVGVGISCLNGAACAVDDNGFIAGTDEGADLRAIGMICDAGGCASIARNQAIVGGTSNQVVGIALGAGTTPVVDDNYVFAGACRASGIINDQAVGVFLAGSGAEVTNNVIFGGFCSNSSGIMAEHTIDAAGQLHANVNSNYINGAGTPNAFMSVSNGLTLNADGDVPAQHDYRNNIFNAGYAAERIGVLEINAGADPRTFDYNDVVGSTLAVYVDEGADFLVSIGEVNALGDMQTGSNLSVYPDLVDEVPFGDFHLNPGSDLIDAGTDQGAPDHDFDAESRPAGQGFDIGPDEAS